MMRSYNSTLEFKDLREATIRLVITDGPKYDLRQRTGIIVEYTGVTSWDIIEGGPEAEEIESMTDKNSIDELHEYLVLHFENGETSTFRNTHVDMHIR